MSSGFDWGKDPIKHAAHLAVARAIKAGLLVRPEACECCGVPCVPVPHHDDYSRPLDVRWLSKPCHSRHHVRERMRQRVAA